MHGRRERETRLSVRSNSDTRGSILRVGLPRAGHSPYWLFPRVPFFLLSFLAQPPHLTLFTLTCRHERNEEHRRHGIMETTAAARGDGGEYAGG